MPLCLTMLHSDMMDKNYDIYSTAIAVLKCVLAPSQTAIPTRTAAFCLALPGARACRIRLAPCCACHSCLLLAIANLLKHVECSLA